MRSRVSDVILDLEGVASQMLGYSVPQKRRVREDLGPLLQCRDILGHSVAASERFRQLQDNDTELENSLNIVIDATMSDSSEHEFEFSGKEVSTLNTSLEL